MVKYIFIAGGVMSGIGKGIATASIGKILQSKGFTVTAVKIDPYINVDAGTMNLLEHGEAFITKDGDQCDQDMGNYERFLDIELTKDNYMTTGRIYQSVIDRERKLGYKGKCVEVVPDIPNEVISRINKAARKSMADFILIEIGGTIGEYQNMLFLEAARMIKLKNPKGFMFILVSYLPIPKMIGEMKTKPTQHAARTLNSAGIQPDIILARAATRLDKKRKEKISTFCNVNVEDVISAPDVKSIYQIPINFEKEGLGETILKKFGVKAKTKKGLKSWERLQETIKHSKEKVRIGIIEKFFTANATASTDCYLSMTEAIKHAAWHFKKKLEIVWMDSKNYDPLELPDKGKQARKNLDKDLKTIDGIIIPGGFGDRGAQGKIEAIRFCRENKIPYFGISLGSRLAIIEFAKNVCKIKGFCNSEFSEKCKNPLIVKLKYQVLGNSPCEIKSGTTSFNAYLPQNTPKENIKNSILVHERHQDQYALNNNFKKHLQKEGMIVSAVNPKNKLAEIIELKDHPFFIGVQFHPEFKSRPLNPHPLFKQFIRTCVSRRTLIR